MDKLSSDPKLARMLAAAMKMGLLGAGASIARAVVSTPLQAPHRKKLRKQLRKYLQAEYIVLPSTKTVRTEDELNTALADVEKESSLFFPGMSGLPNPDKLEPLGKIFQPPELPTPENAPSMVEDFEGAFTEKEYSIMHAAAVVAALMAGTAAGTVLGNKLMAAIRKRRSEAKLEQQNQSLSDLMTEEYRRTRGISKQAQHEVSRPNPGESGTTEKVSRSLAVLYTIYAVLGGVAGYKAGRYYFNSLDPGRKQLDALTDLVREQAVQTDAPKIIVGGGMPDLPGAQHARRRQPGMAVSVHPPISLSI